MLNKVMIIGRLGRNPELRYTQNGTPVTTLNVATDESFVDREGNRVERTEWHRVSVYQRLAENCANYLAKGSLVYVEGSLQTRKWQDPQQPDRLCSSVDIKAQRVQFLDKRPSSMAPREGGFSRQGEDSFSKPLGDNYKGQGEDPYSKPLGDGGYQKPRQDYGQSAPRPYQQQGQQARQNAPESSQAPKEDLGPAFPSEVSAAAMDEVPF